MTREERGVRDPGEQTSKEAGDAAQGSSWEGGMRGCLPGDPVPLVLSFWHVGHLVEVNPVGCGRRDGAILQGREGRQRITCVMRFAAEVDMSLNFFFLGIWT